MDTCVIPLRHGGLSLVQTTDYIYPIVDDPYMMVWISSFMDITNAIVVLLNIHLCDKLKDATVIFLCLSTFIRCAKAYFTQKP